MKNCLFALIIIAICAVLVGSLGYAGYRYAKTEFKCERTQTSMIETPEGKFDFLICTSPTYQIIKKFPK